MHRAIAVGRARRGKAVQEGGLGLFGGAFEEIARFGGEMAPSQPRASAMPSSAMRRIR
jgi:hypothetical protein